jgi:hypothetical protein
LLTGEPKKQYLKEPLLTSLIFFSVSPIFAAPSNLAEVRCYSRGYSSDYLARHSHQTLKDVSVATDGESYIEVVGTSKNGKTYSFYGDQKLKPGLICASFSADGDEESGCVYFKESKQGLLVSPVALRYLSHGQQMVSRGLILNVCEGKHSDGEGCEQGKLRTLTLTPRNPQDRTYFLEPSTCRSSESPSK